MPQAKRTLVAVLVFSGDDDHEEEPAETAVGVQLL